MLSQKNRLKKTKEINQVFSRGKFLSCDFLSLKYTLGSKKPSRLAFSIGISYSSKAVERNRAKRILRAAAKKNLGNWPLGLDGVFFINKKKFPAKIEDAQKRLSRLAEIILQELNRKINH